MTSIEKQFHEDLQETISSFQKPNRKKITVNVPFTYALYQRLRKRLRVEAEEQVLRYLEENHERWGGLPHHVMEELRKELEYERDRK